MCLKKGDARVTWLKPPITYLRYPSFLLFLHRSTKERMLEGVFRLTLYIFPQITDATSVETEEDRGKD